MYRASNDVGTVRSANLAKRNAKLKWFVMVSTVAIETQCKNIQYKFPFHFCINSIAYYISNITIGLTLC